MIEQRTDRASHARPSQQGALTGSVIGFDGQQVAGACVTAVGAGRSVTAAAAPDGTFRLAGLPAGSYALEYRVCAGAGHSLTSPSGYLTTWSGGTSTQNTAARVQVAAGQVRRVPVVMLRPANVAAAIAAGRASVRRELSANGRSLSAAATAKTGKISGKVTGKGKALRGICVQVVPVRNGRGYAATTSKNGTYSVRHVAAGRYHVIFAAPFCPGQGNWLEQVYKDRNNISALFGNNATAVSVRAGHKTAGINAHLRLGGEISGTVTGNSGARLRGICVAAEGAVGPEEIFGFESNTTGNGSYHLRALFPGKYTLQFSIGCGSRGSNYAPATHRGVKISLGQDRTVNEKLAPGASITGTVTLNSSSGLTPLGGICVNANNFSGSVSAFASTRSDGHYRVIGLTGGRYQLQFSPGCGNNGNYTSVTLTAHTTAAHQTGNVNAVLQPGATIQGTITGSGGKPLPGICFEIDTANNASGYDGFDTNGTYSIDQLSAGQYQVGFYGGCGNRGSYAPYWYQNQPSESTASWLKVTTGDVVTIDAPMLPGATITGKVTSGGNALSGVCVDASPQSDAEQDVFASTAGSTRHGTYTIANLEPGQYLISFGCGYGRYAEQWYPGAPDPGTADLVSAPAGRTANINAALQPGGIIKGVVTGQAGHPLPGVCVVAVNTKDNASASGGVLVAFAGFGGAVGDLGITGSRGTYQISGLAAGRYQVSFSPCNGSQRYAEQSHRGNVTVRAGKTTSGVDGHLAAGGTISGHVTGGGKSLRNICVIAASQSSGAIGGAVTGKAGTYTIPALSSGRYTVEFAPCANQNLVTVLKQARVTAPHATKGVNATMQPGGSIAGVVTAGSSGPDVSGTCVEVYSGNSAEPIDAAVTGAHGSYVASGLPVGTYEVYFGDPLCVSAPDLAPQWYNGQLTRAAAMTVSVTAVGSTTSSVDAALQPDAEITGTVSATSAGPISGACVTAVPLSPAAQSATGSLPVRAVTGTTGYALADLVPGNYKVKFSAGCGAAGYATQWWKQKTSQKTATVITVGPDQDQSGISATLSKN